MPKFLLHRSGEPLHRGRGLVDRQHVFLKGDALGRSRQMQPSNPAPMRLGPGGLAAVANVVAQQQRGQSMPRLALRGHRILARTYQIAHRLVGRIGNVDRCQLAGPRQPCQLQTVAPVGLDPIAYPPRRIRRCDHPARVTAFLEQTVYPKPTRPRLVDKHQRLAQ